MNAQQKNLTVATSRSKSQSKRVLIIHGPARGNIGYVAPSFQGRSVWFIAWVDLLAASFWVHVDHFVEVPE